MPSIRPLALCICRYGDRILVQDLVDPRSGERFFRPFGGEIEFGERAADALRREFREELDVELAEPRLLGVIENLFTYDGRAGHEVVFVFDARFLGPTLFERDDLHERTAGKNLVPGIWLKLSEIPMLGVALHPDGLLDLLKASLGPAGTSRTIRGHTDWTRTRADDRPHAG